MGENLRAWRDQGFPALFLGWAWPSVPHRYESGFVVLGKELAFLSHLPSLSSFSSLATVSILFRSLFSWG